MNITRKAMNMTTQNLSMLTKMILIQIDNSAIKDYVGSMMAISISLSMINT